MDTASPKVSEGVTVTRLVILAVPSNLPVLADGLAVTAAEGVCLHSKPCHSVSCFEDQRTIQDVWP